MLRPFCNFGHLPFPCDLSIGSCNQFRCDYCFARLNGRKVWQRSDYTKAFASLASQIRKAKAIQFHPDRPIDLVDFWINQGYGTVVANNCDPFDSINAPLYKEILGLLKAARIPAYIFTKSARLAEFVPILGPEMAVCYATITTMDEKLAAQIEPGAPSPAKRMEDLGKVREMGYYSIAAINPWMPSLSDARQVVDAALQVGVKNFIAHSLHLSRKQASNVRSGSPLGVRNVLKAGLARVPDMNEWCELVNYIHSKGGKVGSDSTSPSPDDIYEDLPRGMKLWPWNDSYSTELMPQWEKANKTKFKMSVPAEEPDDTPIYLTPEDYADDVVESIGSNPLLQGPALREIANVKLNLPKSMNQFYNKPMRLRDYLLSLHQLEDYHTALLKNGSFFLLVRSRDIVFDPAYALWLMQDEHNRLIGNERG